MTSTVLKLEKLPNKTPPTLLGHPEVLINILRYCTNSTLARSLRASYLLYELASPELYHTIQLDTNTFKGILLGADIGGVLEMPEQPSKPGKKKTPAKEKSKEVPVKTSKASSTSTNLKRGLLVHVRIITVTTHFPKVCRPLKWAAQLFTNLKVVRLVPHWINHVETHRALCDNKTGCPFVLALNPPKVVFRNVRGIGLTIGPMKTWEPSNLHTVVYALPPDGRFIGEWNGLLKLDLITSFVKAKTIKVVFLEHESTTFDRVFHDPEGVFGGATMADIAPIRVIELLEYVQAVWHVPKDRLEICGMEHIDFEDRWDLDEASEDECVRRTKLEEKVVKALKEKTKDWKEDCLVFRSRKD